MSYFGGHTIINPRAERSKKNKSKRRKAWVKKIEKRAKANVAKGLLPDGRKSRD